MNDYTPKKDLLNERVILVTGAGDGIGRAAALAYAAHGATVVLLGRTEDKLNEVYDEIEGGGGPQPALFPLDLSRAQAEEYDQFAAVLTKEFGRLDGILHNAAMLGTLTPLELYNDDLWDQVMQVNLRAPYMLTRACLNLLKQAADASVIFTSADVGRKGRAYWGAYGIAAFAVEGMMQIWAAELETNTSIRVNTLDPGPVATRMRRAAYPGETGANLVQPDAVMPAYLYLMGPDSAHVRGQALSAQGEPVPPPGA